jgi:hypothetical protein
MSFVGTLEELPLSDLLRALAAGHKSGRLRLSERDAYGLVVLHQGQIVYAASNAARETLGAILVNRGLLGEPTLRKALRLQHQLKERRPLGAILLDQGALSRETLEAVLREQIEVVLLDLLRWPAGYFRFEPQASDEVDGVAVDVRDLHLDAGTSAEGVLLEATRRLDEERRSGRESEVGASPLASLKELIAALRSPTLSAETSRLLLRHAQRVVARAALFVPRRDGIHGLAQAGVADDDADERVRAVGLGWDDGSTLAEVARRRESFRGRLPPSAGNDALLAALGGAAPAESVVVPLEVEGQPILLLYGDNLPHEEPIGSIEGLELAMLQAGLAIEKQLLRQRLDRLAAGLPPLT